jgi:hypothetical protein
MDSQLIGWPVIPHKETRARCVMGVVTAISLSADRVKVEFDFKDLSIATLDAERRVIEPWVASKEMNMDDLLSCYLCHRCIPSGSARPGVSETKQGMIEALHDLEQVVYDDKLSEFPALNFFGGNTVSSGTCLCAAI